MYIYIYIYVSQWPNCFLHCGWIEMDKNYGLQILEGLGTPYHYPTFVSDTHNMYLQILMARHDASKVLRSTPQTPPLLIHSSLPSSSPTMFHPFLYSHRTRVRITLRIVAMCQKKIYVYILTSINIDYCRCILYLIFTISHIKHTHI